jgi:hypothetical protein
VMIKALSFLVSERELEAEYFRKRDSKCADAVLKNLFALCIAATFVHRLHSTQSYQPIYTVRRTKS